MRGRVFCKLNQKGMTLVEVIVAMAILAIVIIPTLRIFSSTAGTNLRSRQRQRATSVAEGVMESFKAYDMEDLCNQFKFGSDTFGGVVRDTGGTTSMWVSSDLADRDVYNPANTVLRPNDTLKDGIGTYYFFIKHAASEGHLYDVDVTVTPSIAPNVLRMEDANIYSDAIICLEEDEASDALTELIADALQDCEDNFSSIQPLAVTHTIDPDDVEIANFKRVIDLDIVDSGSAQTVTMKITYTCDIEVNYTYTEIVGGSSISDSKSYDDWSYEAEWVDDDTGLTVTEKKVYDNSVTIGDVTLKGRKCKLNHIYLYYFPCYPGDTTGTFGTAAEDEININGNLTDIYLPAAAVDARAQGYEPLQVSVVKQLSTKLGDVDLNLGEVAYVVNVNNTVVGGEIEFHSNLNENMSPLGSVDSNPTITGFPIDLELMESLEDEPVVLLYDVAIHVYEADTMNEVAFFAGTMNE